MPFDFDRALGETEDFLFRQLSSRAAREAQKRKVRRGINEVFRRIRRAALLMVGLLAALVGYSIFVDPIGILTWFVALPTVFLASMVALFWPPRAAAKNGSRRARSWRIWMCWPAAPRSGCWSAAATCPARRFPRSTRSWPG
jgi:hypothetical protein